MARDDWREILDRGRKLLAATTEGNSANGYAARMETLAVGASRRRDLAALFTELSASSTEPDYSGKLRDRAAGLSKPGGP
jgi:hypothetical protein